MLLLLGSGGILALSSYFTGGIRLLTLTVLIITLRHYRNVRNYQNISVNLLFIWLNFAIGFAVLRDINYGNYTYYYLNSQTIVIQWISVLFLPFMLIVNSKYGIKAFDEMIKWFLWFGLLFSLISTLFYGQYVGQFGRLTVTAIGEEGGVVSPLILSYTAVLVIGISIFYLVDNKKANKLYKWIAWIAIVLSAVPFFLGSSRGSVIALLGTPLFISLFRTSLMTKFRIVVIVVSLVGLGVYFAGEFQSNIIDRLLQVQLTDEMDARNMRYRQAFVQFTKSPFFGDSFVVEGFDNYPHNVILEIMQATGLFGLVPFVMILGKGFKAIKNVIRNRPSYSWLGVMFLTGLVQNLFSGSVITAVWLWMSLALLINFNNSEIGKAS